MRLIGYVSVEIDAVCPPDTAELKKIYRGEVIEIGSKKLNYLGPKFLVCSGKVKFRNIGLSNEVLSFLEENKYIGKIIKNSNKVSNPVLSVVVCERMVGQNVSLLLNNDVIDQLNQAGLGLEIWESDAIPELEEWPVS